MTRRGLPTEQPSITSVNWEGRRETCRNCHSTAHIWVPVFAADVNRDWLDAFCISCADRERPLWEGRAYGPLVCEMRDFAEVPLIVSWKDCIQAAILVAVGADLPFQAVALCCA